MERVVCQQVEPRQTNTPSRPSTRESRDAPLAEPTTTVEMFNLRWREARHEPFLVELPGRTMSYDEVKSAAEALGGELDRFELAPGSVVGLHMSNRIFWVVGSLAAWSR